MKKMAKSMKKFKFSLKRLKKYLLIFLKFIDFLNFQNFPKYDFLWDNTRKFTDFTVNNIKIMESKYECPHF